METPAFVFHPVTSDRWDDFETLFGKNGACAGCWCMWWRQTRSAFSGSSGDDRRRAMHEIISAGQVPGIIAYAGGEPAAWCSIAPRSEFPTLGRSRNLKPVDDLPVWSIVCFFVRRGYRRQGLMKALIPAAVDYARSRGAQVVEAYPVDRVGRVDPMGDFTGVASAFRSAGFVEVARRAPQRPVMRFEIAGSE